MRLSVQYNSGFAPLMGVDGTSRDQRNATTVSLRAGSVWSDSGPMALPEVRTDDMEQRLRDTRSNITRASRRLWRMEVDGTSRETRKQ